MEQSTSGVLIEVDDRRQVSLGRVGRHDRYLANVQRDGTIVLTPAVVMLVSDFEAFGGTPPKAAEAASEPAKAAPKKRVGKSVKDQILALVRAAGRDGIAAKDIVKGVTAARSRIYNELASLRNSGQVQNPAGKYILGITAH